MSATPGFSDPSDRDHFVAFSSREALKRAKRRWWDCPGFYVVARELDPINGTETGACSQARVPRSEHVVMNGAKKLLMLDTMIQETDGEWFITMWPFTSKVVREAGERYTGTLADCSGAVLNTVTSNTAESVAEMLNEKAGHHVRGMIRIGSYVQMSQQVNQRREDTKQGEEE